MNLMYSDYDYDYDRRYGILVPRHRGRGARFAMHLVYGLYLISLFTAVPAFLGVIVAYAKRRDAAGTIEASHYRYAIRTFWWGLFWLVVAILLKVVLVGFVVLALLWLWFLWRTCIGWLALLDDRPLD